QHADRYAVRHELRRFCHRRACPPANHCRPHAGRHPRHAPAAPHAAGGSLHRDPAPALRESATTHPKGSTMNARLSLFLLIVLLLVLAPAAAHAQEGSAASSSTLYLPAVA